MLTVLSNYDTAKLALSSSTFWRNLMNFSHVLTALFTTLLLILFHLGKISVYEIFYYAGAYSFGLIVRSVDVYVRQEKALRDTFK